MEGAEAPFTGLTLDFIEGGENELSGAVVFQVRASIGPAIGTFVVAEAAEQPADAKQVAIEQADLPDANDVVQWNFIKTIF